MAEHSGFSPISKTRTPFEMKGSWVSFILYTSTFIIMIETFERFPKPNILLCRPFLKLVSHNICQQFFGFYLMFIKNKEIKELTYSNASIIFLIHDIIALPISVLLGWMSLPHQSSFSVLMSFTGASNVLISFSANEMRS